MQKRKLSKNFTQLLILLAAICGGIFFYYLIFYSDNISSLFSSLISVLSPFLCGIVIAYLLNPVMNFIQYKIFFKIYEKKKKPFTEKAKGRIKTISLILTILFFFLIMYLLIILIIPQLIDSLEIFIKALPLYMSRAYNWINGYLNENPEILKTLNDYWGQISQVLTEKLLPTIQDLITKASPNIFDGVASIVGGILDFIIGIVFAIYLLGSKKLLCAQAKKITYSVFKEKRANTLINNTRYTHKMFGGFLTAKIIDSLIIGILCFIGCSILGIPYALLISTTVGVTNIIPFFGPIIGAVPCALILLLASPVKCLIFIIFVLVLQQFDGNILGPKIMGNTIGLSALWVLFAITVLGGFFGVFGMIVGVPIFAVIYSALKKHIETKLEKMALPVDTDFYIDNDYKTDESDSTDGSEFQFTNKDTVKKDKD